MKVPGHWSWVGLLAVFVMFFGATAPAYAVFTPRDITIIEVKMTGIESVVLMNTSSEPLNLSNYILEYFNKSVPASLGAPTDTQELPNISLAPNQTTLLNGGSSPTCGAAAVDSLSLSLSDSSGYLMVVKVHVQTDKSLLLTPHDDVSWTSSASGAAIVKVPSGASEPNALWYRNLSDGTWTKGLTENTCSLLSFVSPSQAPTFVQWATGEAPPATIISIASDPAAPGSNIGLAAPIITELLPNPAEPLTDSDDEFVEIYNPNDMSFDLSGFGLQTSLTGSRTYKFPDGTLLPAKSFQIFTSAESSFSLSNSGGQLRLVDRDGRVISQSEPYGKAKEGQSLALANGKWYWTAKPTPGQANIIEQKSSTAGSSRSRLGNAVRSASTNGNSSAQLQGPAVSQNDPLHPWTLAMVGAAVILYAGYEYRNDLANQLYRFRRYREARRTAGKAD